MGCNCNEVYVNPTEPKKEQVEINPEYAYMTIPAKYVCVYHKLLCYMADFGKTMIDNCDSLCKKDSKNIISCWNIFQSAIACHNLGMEKQADLFINYIVGQLKILYIGTGKKVYHNSVPLSITPDGRLKAVVSCAPETHFYVDQNTGNLYQQYIDSQGDGRIYAIDDGDLTTQISD